MSDINAEELAEEAGIDPVALKSDLGRIRLMGEVLVQRQKEFDEATERMEEAKRKLLKVEREDLPMLLEEAGMSGFSLTSGERIEIEEELTTSITDKTRERALRWLIKNKFGGLIKTNVTVSFGRGERTKAQAAMKALSKNYDEVIVKEEVHHSTLKSFVKEQMRSGEPVPMDLFNVRPYSKAVITRK